MVLSLSVLTEAMRVEPPAGGLSALAWVIIVALAGVCAAVVPALWYRGNKLQDKMYEDLKICNDKRAKTEEDVLGLMKVLRVQMEKSRGGPKG
jgi:uncharacterized protein YdgA (DUF945 family)